ncbi:MAG: hypothetical protein KDC57_11765 [Saprospiraceae bacterium]|nr:hypothetical protein [Saprospiraceae bacterium]
MENDTYVQKAVKWAERKGFTKIKALLEDYESPKSFTRSGDDEVIQPIVTGVQMGTKHYIELGIKTDKPNRLISKWKLIEMLSQRGEGKFYVLVPYGHKAFVDRILKDHNIHAVTVSI